MYKQQTKLCKAALDILGPLDNLILIDGKINPFKNFKDKKVETIIKGDAKCYNIGPASIIAKVFRDKIMEQLSDEVKRCYNWEKNKGYYSAEQMDGIMKYGLSEHHR